MCGIYGAINIEHGAKWEPAILSGLTWANRERGTHSCGFFDSSGRMIKRAVDPKLAITEDRVRRWLNNSHAFAWAIGGHTRHATQGAVNKRNAHPFRYGDVIGSHNGMVDAPNSYEVDSEFLFDSINQSDYKALNDIGGYWGLSWFDKRDGRFYLTMHNGSLAYTVYNGVCYYSSDGDHLESFVDSKVYEFEEGEVIAFDRDGTVLQSRNNEIEPIENKGGKYSYAYGNYGYGACGYDLKKGAGSVKTYYYGDYNKNTTTIASEESEWRDSWSSYLHSMSDEEFNTWEGEAY